MTKIIIKELAVDELIPYAMNSRTHSDEQVAQVAASINEFGFLIPVVVDSEQTIIAGHCRVLAAERLGLATVPCIEASHLTEDQKKAFVIADNKLALNAGWNDELLISSINELDASGFNLELLGFSLDELDDLLIADDDVDIDFDKDEGRSGATINYLNFGKAKIPLSDEEYEQLIACLDKYVTDNGAFFGFASHLLGLNHA